MSFIEALCRKDVSIRVATTTVAMTVVSFGILFAGLYATLPALAD